MQSEQLSLPSVRTLAILAILCFLPVVVTFFTERTWWTDYPGIFFHLFIFLLVPLLPAPSWAKAAGYGWLILDVTTAILTINHIPYESALPVRLGGHIFGGMWLIMASLQGSRVLQIVGIISGLYLFCYSFVSPYFSMKALAPASLGVVLWLLILAVQNGVKFAKK